MTVKEKQLTYENASELILIALDNIFSPEDVSDPITVPHPTKRYTRWRATNEFGKVFCVRLKELDAESMTLTVVASHAEAVIDDSIPLSFGPIVEEIIYLKKHNLRFVSQLLRALLSSANKATEEYDLQGIKFKKGWLEL